MCCLCSIVSYLRIFIVDPWIYVLITDFQKWKIASQEKYGFSKTNSTVVPQRNLEICKQPSLNGRNYFLPHYHLPFLWNKTNVKYSLQYYLLLHSLNINISIINLYYCIHCLLYYSSEFIASDSSFYFSTLWWYTVNLKTLLFPQIWILGCWQNCICLAPSEKKLWENIIC